MLRHYPFFASSRCGFSLVELSIVLVILGLLVGGILAGQSLIRASALRSVSSDYTKYRTATLAFRDKYMGIPGDLSNATSFWGAQDGNDGLGTDCTDIASTTPLTCNGNGSGELNNNNENFRYWQHLANAGLIEGIYSGTADDIINHTGGTPGVNTPVTKLSPGVFTPTHRPTNDTSDINTYPTSSVDVYFFGKKSSPTTTSTATRPVLLTEDAWNIDTKIDDGRPGTGKVRSFKKGASATWASGSANCATDTDARLAEYDLSFSLQACTLLLYWN